MKHQTASWKERGKLLMCILIALAGVQFLLSCEQPSDPSKDVNCGSGNVEWDVKAQVCRDLGRHAIVPASCCGY